MRLPKPLLLASLSSLLVAAGARVYQQPRLAMNARRVRGVKKIVQGM